MTTTPTKVTLTELIDRDDLVKLAYNPKTALEDKGKLLKILSHVPEGAIGFDVEYSNKKYAKLGYAGRLCPLAGASKQYLSRDVRKALSPGERDVDMVSANASMMAYLLHHHGWEGRFPEVVDYCDVERRESLISELMTADPRLSRGKCKELYTSLPMGRSVRLWCEEHGVLPSALPEKVEFYSHHIRRFVDDLMNHQEHQHFLNIGRHQKEGKGEFAAKSSAMTFLLQDIEQQVMRICREYVHAHTSGEVTLPMHDGFQTTLTEESLVAEHILQMETLVSAFLGGDFITFVVKPMDDISPAVKEIVEEEKSHLHNAMDACMLCHTITDSHLAELVHAVHGDTITFTGTGENKWHRFLDHRWKEIGVESVKAAVRMTVEVVELHIGRGNQEDPKDKMTKLTNALRDDSRQHKVVNQLKDLNLMGKDREDFLDKLDLDFGLFGVANGVYDFIKYEFRPGLPSDNTTLACKWNYTPDSNPEARAYLEKYFTDILPNPDDQKFYLTLVASTLGGHQANYLEEGCYLQGKKAGNAKDTTNELVRRMLGPFFAECDAKVLTMETNDGSSANEAYEKLRDARYVSSNEPAADRKIDSATFKKFTGGGSMVSRPIFGKMHTWPINFATFTNVNKMPEFTSIDEGVERRVQIITFPTVFTDYPDPNNPSHKQVDSTVKARMKTDWGLCQEFFLMLVELHREVVTPAFFDRTKWIRPANVKLVTRKYLDNQRPLSMFVAAMVQQTTDAKDRVPCGELHKAFGVFCREQLGMERTPTITPDIMLNSHGIDMKNSSGNKYLKIILNVAATPMY